jgi:hypothetical protein
LLLLTQSEENKATTPVKKTIAAIAEAPRNQPVTQRQFAPHAIASEGTIGTSATDAGQPINMKGSNQSGSRALSAPSNANVNIRIPNTQTPALNMPSPTSIAVAISSRCQIESELFRLLGGFRWQKSVARPLRR